MGVGSKWLFHPKLTAIAVELVNAHADMLGEGIERTMLSSLPIKINSGGPHVRYLDASREPRRRAGAKEREKGSVSAITGSPGIGKSWTLFYALQQALMYGGANVLLFFQKSEESAMYLRRNDKIYAWKSKSKGAADSCFKRSDVLVLLDPKEADRGGANFVLGMMKLLYAASNIKVHISNLAVKENGKMQAYAAPPLDDELEVIIGCIDPSLEIDVIKKRREDVGNLIRYILNEEKYEDRVRASKERLSHCADDLGLLKRAVEANGKSPTAH